jgi:hypothetical protein
MFCGLLLVALTLAIATWAATVTGLRRTRPHLFWPLCVATLFWVLAAIVGLLSDLFEPPEAWHFEAPIAMYLALLVSIVCATWAAVAFFVGWYRSGSK